MLGLVVFLLAQALGSRVELLSVMVIFPFVLLLSMLPISLAGWGVREGAMVMFFGLIGLSAKISLSASLLFGICMFLAALPGGVLWLIYRPQSNDVDI